MTNFKPQHEQILLDILGAYFRDTPVSVYVFGSRAGTSPRVDSDLDLLLDARDEVPLSTIAQLKEAFEDSDLPFRVDVVLRMDVSPEFYQKIQEDLILLCTFKGTVRAT